MSDFRIKFLTRHGCHLCDDARPLVDWVGVKVGVVVEEVDVDENDGLVTLYGMRIPVLLGPDGDVIAEGVIADRRALKRDVSKAKALSRSD